MILLFCTLLYPSASINVKPTVKNSVPRLEYSLAGDSRPSCQLIPAVLRQIRDNRMDQIGRFLLNRRRHGQFSAVHASPRYACLLCVMVTAAAGGAVAVTASAGLAVLSDGPDGQSHHGSQNRYDDHISQISRHRCPLLAFISPRQRPRTSGDGSHAPLDSPCGTAGR